MGQLAYQRWYGPSSTSIIYFDEINQFIEKRWYDRLFNLFFEPN